ncbi:unnamed protein product [Agarophyton chilense]|eukprot:gb/GEZJ01002178.1/.p1 GENE.gb/GEZJ01002178.1/~~gb/GEZJ01002178.1/.p1  ORF type:complete len:1229 (-),score=176.26 gb/GEZJ01002178.1/:567-4253(-)
MELCFCSTNLVSPILLRRSHLAWRSAARRSSSSLPNPVGIVLCRSLETSAFLQRRKHGSSNELHPTSLSSGFLGMRIPNHQFCSTNSWCWKRRLNMGPTSQLVVSEYNAKKIDPESAIVQLRSQFDNIRGNPSVTESNDVARLVENAFNFKLDRFQLDALRALCNGKSVVLSAPTGAGKTIIGEIAIYLALCRRMRVFYTTPLKALSNQKFYDFKNQFGKDRIGLLTGDVTVNRDADIVVMTTEVYRNMLYAESNEARDSSPPTDSLFAVVFDEFHYLNDQDRGTVWEESVIHSPEHILLVALSATMSNTGDLKDWFNNVQGPTSLITSDVRPVPLKFGYCDSEGLTPLFAEGQGKGQDSKRKKGFAKKENARKRSAGNDVKMHPKLLRRLKESNEGTHGKVSRGNRNSKYDEQDELQSARAKYRDVVERNRGRRQSRFTEIPSFPYIVRLLKRRDMLPCIIFIFSRAGCDRAADSASHNREGLVTAEEQDAIRRRLDSFSANHPGLVNNDRLSLAMKGIASHHAGLLPLWKVVVEELFQDGLIKVVFATETLAAGINMPARTTVISALSKRAGEAGFTDLTTSEVLQMAGRAGRRGKDTVGHSVILRSRNEGALEAFKVLTAGVGALESKFAPNYGMVLNLLSNRPLVEAKKLVDRSFGNFIRESESIQDSNNRSSFSEEATQTILREKQALEYVLAEAESLVESVTEIELRSYVKQLERGKAEKRALAYLVQQSVAIDASMIEDTLSFAPTGTKLLLKDRGETPSSGADRRQKRRDYSAALKAAGDGDLGEELKSFYFSLADSDLEDVSAEEGEEEQDMVEAIFLDLYDGAEGGLPMFLAVDAHGNLRIFSHTAVAKLFYDEEPVVVENYASEWFDASLPGRAQWRSIAYDQYSAPLPLRLEGLVPIAREWRGERARKEGDSSETETLCGLADLNRPEILAQKERVRNARATILQHELHSKDDIRAIISAKRAIPKIKGILDGTLDPYGVKRRRGKKSSRYSPGGADENYKNGERLTQRVHNTNWDDFINLSSVLQHYGFLDDNYNVTSLGSLGAKVRSENELWTSLMLLEPSLGDVSPMHLGAVLGASLIENNRSDVHIGHEVSEEVRDCLKGVDAERVRLVAVQNEFQVETPVYLDAELMGLVEMWSSGVSWVGLLRNTTLHEGDACRILRRVLDLLRQVPHLPVLSEKLKRNAKRTVALLDRFPVTDDRTYVVRSEEKESYEA